MEREVGVEREETLFEVFHTDEAKIAKLKASLSTTFGLNCHNPDHLIVSFGGAEDPPSSMKLLNASTWEVFYSGVTSATMLIRLE